MAYNSYPNYSLIKGEIEQGYKFLSRWLLNQENRVILIDGFCGVDWVSLINNLKNNSFGNKCAFIDFSLNNSIKERFKIKMESSDKRGQLLSEDISNLFTRQDVEEYKNRINECIKNDERVICFGTGSTLIDIDGLTVWINISKEMIWNNIEQVKNFLLASPPFSPADSINYFDWPWATNNLSKVFPDLDLFVDLNNSESPMFIEGKFLREAFAKLSTQPFRVKPIFHSSLWGGQYIKQYLNLDEDFVNCSWTYDLVSTENSILLSDHNFTIEVPFDVLYSQEGINIIGKNDFALYRNFFPIRFNITDTIKGKNLSCQVHPPKDIANNKYGYPYLEDEIYYILRSESNSLIHLGLREKINSSLFREAAQEARDKQIAFDISDFVASWPSQNHSLFSIPSGTIHFIGKNNLVLEIISTPLVHTYRIYDYLRTDSKGNRRPVHLDDAWDVLDNNRTTTYVNENLISRPAQTNKGKYWTEYIHKSPKDFLIGINRIDIGDTYNDLAEDRRAYVMNLVEGESVLIEWGEGNHELNYLETILIPQAIKPYRIINQGKGICRLVRAYVK